MLTKTIISLFGLLLLTGCFATTGEDRVVEGAAVYRLQSDKCNLEVVSARAWSGSVALTEDCAFAAEVETTKEDMILQLLEIIK